MNENATVMVHWPGQSTAMCDTHAEQAQRIAMAMGMPLPSQTALTEPAECKNCTNEAAKVSGA